MEKQTLKSVLLKKGLPLLANVLTGGTAKPVLSLLKTVVDLHVKDEDHMQELLKVRPDLILKLQEFEMTQKVELQRIALQATQLEIEQSKAYLQDKQNARMRETELAKATGKRDWLMMSLAIVVVIGFFGLISLMVIGENAKKATDNGAINQLFGALVAGFSMVLSYFFGSSKSSAEKDNTIANHIKSSTNFK